MATATSIEDEDDFEQLQQQQDEDEDEDEDELTASDLQRLLVADEPPTFDSMSLDELAREFESKLDVFDEDEDEDDWSASLEGPVIAFENVSYAEVEASLQAPLDFSDSREYLEKQVQLIARELQMPTEKTLTDRELRALRGSDILRPQNVEDFLTNDSLRQRPKATPEEEADEAGLEFLQPQEMPPEIQENFQQAIAETSREIEREWLDSYKDRVLQGKAQVGDVVDEKTGEPTGEKKSEDGTQWVWTRINGRLQRTTPEKEMPQSEQKSWRIAQMVMDAASVVTENPYAAFGVGALKTGANVAGRVGLRGLAQAYGLSPEVANIASNLVFDVVFAIPVVLKAPKGKKREAAKRVAAQIVMGTFRQYAGGAAGAYGTFFAVVSEGVVDAVLFGREQGTDKTEDEKVATQVEQHLREMSVAMGQTPSPNVYATPVEDLPDGSKEKRERIRDRVYAGLLKGLVNATGKVGFSFAAAQGLQGGMTMTRSMGRILSPKLASVVPEAMSSLPAEWMNNVKDKAAAHIPFDKLADVPQFTAWNSVKQVLKVYKLAAGGNEYIDALLKSGVTWTSAQTTQFLFAKQANAIADKIVQANKKFLSKEAIAKIRIGVVRQYLNAMQEREFVAAHILMGAQLGVGAKMQDLYENNKEWVSNMDLERGLADVVSQVTKDESAVNQNVPSQEQVDRHIEEEAKKIDAEFEQLDEKMLREAATEKERDAILQDWAFRNVQGEKQQTEQEQKDYDFHTMLNRDRRRRQDVRARRTGAAALEQAKRARSEKEYREAMKEARDAAQTVRDNRFMEVGETIRKREEFDKMLDEAKRVEAELAAQRRRAAAERLKARETKRRLRDEIKILQQNPQQQINESLEFMDVEVAKAIDDFKEKHPEAWDKAVGAGAYRSLLWQYAEAQVGGKLMDKASSALRSTGKRAFDAVGGTSFVEAINNAASGAVPSSVSAQNVEYVWSNVRDARDRLVRVARAVPGTSPAAPSFFKQQAARAAQFGARHTVRAAKFAARNGVAVGRATTFAANVADIAATGTQYENYTTSTVNGINTINQEIENLRELRDQLTNDPGSIQAVKDAYNYYDSGTKEYYAMSALKLAGYHPHKGRLRGLMDASTGANFNQGVESLSNKIGAWWDG